MVLVNGKEVGLVAAGAYHSVGVQQDGSVIAAGQNNNGQINVSGWAGVVQVACSTSNTYGVTEDGHVLAAGTNGYNVLTIAATWTDVVHISAESLSSQVIVCKGDGTAAAAGYNNHGQLGVGGWTDIVQVAAGYMVNVGLKQDGSVVVAGSTAYGLTDAENWTDIVQIAAGYEFILGLKSDGTVVSAGRNNYGERNVGGWNDIVQIAAGARFSLGLKADGTVVGAGESPSNMGAISDVVCLAGGFSLSLALRADGSAEAFGSNTYGQLNVDAWSLSIGQYYPISGITSIDGTPTPMTVRCYEEITGQFQIETQSDTNGQYTLHLPRWYSGYIMSIPPAGHRPMAHGPITPPPEESQV